MDHKLLTKLMQEHFGPEPEVFEVAMYAMSTLLINDQVLSGIMSKSTEVRGIPPESYHLVKRFDNGLTMNNFWLDNFAPIKMQLALDDIKMNSMREYIQFIESKPSRDAALTAGRQAKAVLMSRFDVLTVIAFIWKGVGYAEEFDRKFRMTIQLTKEHERYFKKLIGE